MNMMNIVVTMNLWFLICLFRIYELSRVLPEGHILIFNHDLFILTMMAFEPCAPIAQVVVTGPHERALISELLAHHLHYCPSAVALSICTGKTVAQCRAILQEAIRQGRSNEMMGPCRSLTKRVREKLHRLGIELATIQTTGYVLLALDVEKQALKERHRQASREEQS